MASNTYNPTSSKLSQVTVIGDAGVDAIIQLPKSQEQATEIMLHIHQKGIGICGLYTYEIAESKATQVLEKARKNEHPLQVKLEKK